MGNEPSIILENLENRLSNLEEKCIGNIKHELKPFVYYGKESDYEKICKKCGGYIIDKMGIYSKTGLLHYIDSERYTALLEESKIIKNEMDKRKNL
ncbi:MAG: hypothetical protein AABW45_01360 [Nanoarchaeota archaeon]